MELPYSPNMELCQKNLNQGKYAFEIHPKESYKHGNNPDFGIQIAARQLPGDNWRTYKK